MKARKKAIQTFPVALALQAFSAPTNAIEITQSVRVTEDKFEAQAAKKLTATSDVITTTSDYVEGLTGDSFEQEVHVLPDEWGEEQDMAFDTLVMKEALQTITSEELEELNALQKLRRRFVNPPSSDDILARLRREKLDRELLQVLQRNVRIQRFT